MDLLNEALTEMMFARASLAAHEALHRGDQASWELQLAAARVDDGDLRAQADGRRARLETDLERAGHDAIQAEERAARDATLALLTELGAARGW